MRIQPSNPQYQPEIIERDERVPRVRRVSSGAIMMCVLSGFMALNALSSLKEDRSWEALRLGTASVAALVAAKVRYTIFNRIVNKEN